MKISPGLLPLFAWSILACSRPSPLPSAAHPASPSGLPPARTIVYVSGFDSEITSYAFDPPTGALVWVGATPAGEDASYLAVSPSKRFLFAVNETDDSRVVGFRIDPASGALARINDAPTGGRGTTHLAVDPSGRYLISASYGEGTVALFSIDDIGRVARLGDPFRPNGDCQNAHQIVFDRSGKHVFVPCLGSNYVAQLVLGEGTLRDNTPAVARLLRKSDPAATRIGPRHMTFSPDERHAYVLAEHGSDVAWFKYDRATGTLSDERVVKGTEKPGASAHVVFHPGGAVLYASHRRGQSLARYTIAPDGTPSLVEEWREGIATPRDFTIDPSGRWLVSANQANGRLLVFALAPATGALRLAHTVERGHAPSFVGFVTLP